MGNVPHPFGQTVTSSSAVALNSLNLILVVLSWLVGSKFTSWELMEDIFADYLNAALYTDEMDVIQIVRVGEFDDFHTQYSVLLSPSYLTKLKVRFIKMAKYVAFPTFNEEFYLKLVQLNGVRGRAFYDNDGFRSGWIVYDCKRCKEAQRKHIDIALRGDRLQLHLEVMNSRH